MKHGYKQIGLDAKHEELHRAAFMQPETIYVSASLPTVDNTKLGELKVYYDGTNYWLYTKLSKTLMGKIQWTV